MTFTPGAERGLRVGACLSLSGRFGRFGEQAATGLEVWSKQDGSVELIIEDDGSDARTLAGALPAVMRRCDVLLGPYSTRLMREAGGIAAEAGRLLWNHGGSGDDVEAAHPGHVVSVAAPASRYAVPFVQHLAVATGPGPLWIAQGRGAFGRQVAAGAAAEAGELGIETVRIASGKEFPPAGEADWNLFSAGTFEDDVDMVRRSLELARPPKAVCAVAAGVQEFGREIKNPEGIYGIGQWAPGIGCQARLGPAEGDFLRAYAARTGALPDYPAVQAVAAAVLAVHCARLAGGTSREATWAAATALDTTTLLGRFKIDPTDGAQVGHGTTLVQWRSGGPVAI
jgi:ABC-type branched-subunit amino acid transport system substrate-binding protein